MDGNNGGYTTMEYNTSIYHAPIAWCNWPCQVFCCGFVALCPLRIWAIMGCISGMFGFGRASSNKFRSEVEIFDWSLYHMVPGKQKTDSCEQSNRVPHELRWQDWKTRSMAQRGVDYQFLWMASKIATRRTGGFCGIFGTMPIGHGKFECNVRMFLSRWIFPGQNGVWIFGVVWNEIFDGLLVPGSETVWKRSTWYVSSIPKVAFNAPHDLEDTWGREWIWVFTKCYGNELPDGRGRHWASIEDFTESIN